MRFDAPELMITRLAAEIRDGDVVHVGYATPVSLLASFLALETHAPNLFVHPISVSGVRRQRSFPLTVSMVEAMTLTGGLLDRVIDVYDHAEAGDFDIEPVAPAQIDMYGNMNISVIGDYGSPKVRLPGAGGIATLGGHSRHRVIVYTTRHDRRTFVPRVDFVSGAGYLDGGNARREAGIPGGGPALVVTNLAVLGFEDESGRMTLRSVHPWSSVEEVRAQTGFELIVPAEVPETPAPTDTELHLLRRTLDPFGLRVLEFLGTGERRERILEALRQEEALFMVA